MKTNQNLLTIIAVLITLAHVQGQSPAAAGAHRIDAIVSNPDHTISLNLSGVVPSPFAPYYDIYPLEVSTNLVDWSPLAMVLRTNASPDALSYLDQEAPNLPRRFYRTPANLFITPFPKPSGPYPVGTVSRLLTDPSRTNRYNIPENSSFMVTFWYPAEASAGVLPGAYVEKEVTLASPSYWSPRPASMIAQFVSHALPGVPVATNHADYPVLIYSHGFGHRRQNTDKAEELASHGYVVVAIEHTEAFASVFPSGQVVYGHPRCDDLACLRSYLDDRMKDYQFVMDELSRLNTNDAQFAGRLDMERVGAFGWSLGGATVAEFCRIDARCKAVVLLDAGGLLEVPPNLLPLGLQRPFLSFNQTDDDEWLTATRAVFAKATKDAFWCQIENSTHVSFSDHGTLINDQTRTGDPTPASRAQSQTIRACMVSFFDKYLKGEDDDLLDNPEAVYPNISKFRSK